MSSYSLKLRRMILAALFLAIALVLPFITGGIPTIGNMLCPMHIPVLLCGFFCGPLYAALIGFIAPLLRFALFGMPPLMPTGLGMAFELATYGAVSGLLYSILPKKAGYIYVSLIGAMLAGRVVWGAARMVIYGISGKGALTWATFMSGAFLTAYPGIILQLVLIPALVIALKKYTRT